MLLRGWLFSLPTTVAIAELCATPNTNATELSQPMLPAVESKLRNHDQNLNNLNNNTQILPCSLFNFITN